MGRRAAVSGTEVYEALREDIIEGVLPANTRLKVMDLAKRYGASAIPVREALQQLRGEGFVAMSPNRGARVRPIDEAFVRDVYELEAVVDRYMMRWFVSVATDEDVAKLRALVEKIEDLNFRDMKAHAVLDAQFHGYMYVGHYNRYAYETWKRNRAILNSLSASFPLSAHRRETVLLQHRQLLKAIEERDEATACQVIFDHLSGSGEHIVNNMRYHSAKGSNGADPVPSMDPADAKG